MVTSQPNPIDIFMGSRIKARRLELGLDQKTLAASLGITLFQLERHESGSERVSITQLRKFEKVLKVSPNFLFRQDDASPFSIDGIAKPDCWSAPRSSRFFEEEEDELSTDSDRK
uniref:Helix-turn-helix domain protein n=1 Tax=Rhizobium rhizogenes TaxID=359 RepID=A0A7S4ZRK4_RHIRH|nr:helix-turn-helix domain protein [Rhizobium rhizogenes]QCL09609.1 helix-turn-helix domain protein [Rhizobium rhizogenes]